MIYLIPGLNALFGWMIIEALIYFLFQPSRKKNFFIFEIQGVIPKALPALGEKVGAYAAENFMNISKLKEGLLTEEKLAEINSVLEKKVDQFLRVKLPERLPILSMFVSESLIGTMKEALMKELNQLVPDMINLFASDLEKKYDVKKMIAEKFAAMDAKEIQQNFQRMAGKNILMLKLFIALLGFALGWMEVLMIQM